MPPLRRDELATGKILFSVRVGLSLPETSSDCFSLDSRGNHHFRNRGWIGASALAARCIAGERFGLNSLKPVAGGFWSCSPGPRI